MARKRREDVAILLDQLGDDVPRGWVRVDSVLDLWVPIVDPRQKAKRA